MKKLTLFLSLAVFFASCSGEPIRSVETPPLPESVSEPICKYEDLELPVIVFSAAGSIPDEVEQEILERVVNPYVDYYTEQGKIILSVVVEPLESTSEDIHYSFGYVYANGGNGGAVIFDGEDGIEYWEPDCMVCTFSDAYRLKYPEVVEGY